MQTAIYDRTRTNRWRGDCDKCDARVKAGDGLAARIASSGRWVVLCIGCGPDDAAPSAAPTAVASAPTADAPRPSKDAADILAVLVRCGETDPAADPRTLKALREAAACVDYCALLASGPVAAAHVPDAADVTADLLAELGLRPAASPSPSPSPAAIPAASPSPSPAASLSPAASPAASASAPAASASAPAASRRTASAQKAPKADRWAALRK